MTNEGTPYYKLYESILNLDPKIRFVTIIDCDGRLIFGGQKEGIQNYLSEEDQKKGNPGKSEYRRRAKAYCWRSRPQGWKFTERKSSDDWGKVGYNFSTFSVPGFERLSL